MTAEEKKRLVSIMFEEIQADTPASRDSSRGASGRTTSRPS